MQAVNSKGSEGSVCPRGGDSARSSGCPKDVQNWAPEVTEMAGRAPEGLELYGGGSDTDKGHHGALCTCCGVTRLTGRSSQVSPLGHQTASSAGVGGGLPWATHRQPATWNPGVPSPSQESPEDPRGTPPHARVLRTPDSQYALQRWPLCLPRHPGSGDPAGSVLSPVPPRPGKVCGERGRPASPISAL